MDYITIDNYKRSRVEILLNLFFNSRFKNRNDAQAIGITQLVTTLAVTGVLFIVGVLIFGKVNDSIAVGGTSTSANQTGISGQILGGFELGVIGLIVLAAVVILGVLFTLGGSRSSSDEEDEDDEEKPLDKERYTDMKTFNKKEEKFKKDYYKEEPDYDEAKQSRFKSWFKRNKTDKK